MKKILALILALLMTMAIFAGCGSNAEADVATGDEAVVNNDVLYNVYFEAFYDDNGERLFTVVETFAEEPTTVEHNNLGFSAEPDTKVSDVLTESYVEDLTIVDENGTFLGWMIYEETVTSVDEDGFENYETVKLDGLYTTDEVMDMVVTDCSYRFVAKWSDISDDYYKENGYEV